MLIITGTGRCGTATLAGIFGGHHEFRAQYLLEKYFLNADPTSDPFGRIETRIAAMLDLHQGVDSPTFVDSSNLYIHFIDAISVLDPSARFILSVRNGKDFVRSAHSRRWHEYTTFGSAPPRDDPWYERWSSFSPLQKNVWIWVYRNRKALNGMRAVPESQKLVLRIEDIGKPETLGMVEAFAGIEIKEKTYVENGLNANPAFDLPPKEEWSERMHKDFDEIAGGLMRFFGYMS